MVLLPNCPLFVPTYATLNKIERAHNIRAIILLTQTNNDNVCSYLIMKLQLSAVCILFLLPEKLHIICGICFFS